MGYAVASAALVLAFAWPALAAITFGVQLGPTIAATIVNTALMLTVCHRLI